VRHSNNAMPSVTNDSSVTTPVELGAVTVGAHGKGFLSILYDKGLLICWLVVIRPFSTVSGANSSGWRQYTPQER